MIIIVIVTRSVLSAVYDIPPPDYERNSAREVQHSSTTVMMDDREDGYEPEEGHGSLSPGQIRSMMSKEQKDLQRDFKIMQKR